MAGIPLHAETVSPLTRDEKDYLLGCCARLPEVFAVAKVQMLPDIFDPAAEASYKVLWLSLLKTAEVGGAPVLFADPSKARLLVEINCKALVEAHPNMLVPEMQKVLFADSPEGLLCWIYECVLLSDLDAKTAYSLLQRLLQEKIQREALRYFQQAGTQVISNLPALLHKLHDKASASSVMSDDPLDDPFPEDWQPTKLDIQPTGLQFVDDLMRGGRAPGEVYGIIGCTGVGKTTLGLQLAYSDAMQEQLRYFKSPEKEKGQLRYAYFFHYEAGKDEMRRRLMVHAAQIDRNVLEDADKHTKPLSRTDDPSTWRDYEKQRFKALIAEGKFEAENERMVMAKARVSRNMRMIDMSCPPGAPKRGMGFVAEAAAIIQLGVQRGMPPSSVYFDYATIMADRHISARNMDKSNLRHLLGGMGDECHRLIAAPYDCCVWILHQLTGEANKFSPHKEQSHADSAESKSFAVNMWFAFTLGTMLTEANCLLFHRSKSRRAGETKGGPTRLVRLDGAFGTFDSDTKGWVYNGQIMKSYGEDKLLPGQAGQGLNAPPSLLGGKDMMYEE